MARLRAVRHKSEGVQAQIREALLLRQVYDLILFVIMILVELIIPRILRFRGWRLRARIERSGTRGRP